MTIDDMLGFNGALTRFEWTLIGNKELFISYHSYKFDDLDVKYKDLLTPGYANPEYMCYEQHRVWVVEADLMKVARHVYGKRRFYVDKDSWQMVMTDSCDGRGDLWRTALLNTAYDYAVKGYTARTEMFHDLQASAYISVRLVNETEPSNYMIPPKGKKFYTPQNLRKLGRR